MSEGNGNRDPEDSQDTDPKAGQQHREKGIPAAAAGTGKNFDADVRNVCLLYTSDSRVVIVSIFKTKQRRFRIGKAINSLCEIFQCERLFPDGKRCLRCPQTADIVSGVVNRTEQLRIVFCPGVGNEKGGVDVYKRQTLSKRL